MKTKIITAIVATFISAVAQSQPSTPGYTQGFTANGNCVIDWDNRNGYEPIIRDCGSHQFFVSVADNYVLGQGHFIVGTGYGGTFGVNDGRGWLYEDQSASPWNAWGNINADGTGTLSFLNGGYSVRAPHDDWAWALFAENGVGGQTWFGDSFTWNTTAIARVATVPGDVDEPGVLALFILGLLIGGWRWAEKGTSRIKVLLKNGRKLFRPSIGPSMT